MARAVTDCSNFFFDLVDLFGLIDVLILLIFSQLLIKFSLFLVFFSAEHV
jgi:hypothetical protein